MIDPNILTGFILFFVGFLTSAALDGMAKATPPGPHRRAIRWLSLAMLVVATVSSIIIVLKVD